MFAIFAPILFGIVFNVAPCNSGSERRYENKVYIVIVSVIIIIIEMPPRLGNMMLQ